MDPLRSCDVNGTYVLALCREMLLCTGSWRKVGQRAEEPIYEWVIHKVPPDPGRNFINGPTRYSSLSAAAERRGSPGKLAPCTRPKIKLSSSSSSSSAVQCEVRLGWVRSVPGDWWPVQYRIHRKWKRKVSTAASGGREGGFCYKPSLISCKEILQFQSNNSRVFRETI